MTGELITVNGLTVVPVAALFAVTCPTCDAAPSQRCLGPWRRLTPSKSHKARADLALNGSDPSVD